MGQFVIVAYGPKAGKEAARVAAVEEHLRVLRSEQLVTEAPASVMRASDGTIVEVFQWRSAGAVEEAHGNPAVQALWAEFAAACDYVPLASLEESQRTFAQFEPVSL